MDLRFTPEEIAFRDEVRTFFTTEVPLEIRRKVIEGRGLSKAGHRHRAQDAAQARLGDAATGRWNGAAAIGRRSSSIMYQEEMQAAGVPPPLAFNVSMNGPVLIQFGTEAQKQRFLPRMAALDDWWCQGFSEPGSGSDLASLKTTRGARGRPLHRQRPEDLDHAGAARRLDLLPGAHRPRAPRSSSASPTC